MHTMTTETTSAIWDFDLSLPVCSHSISISIYIYIYIGLMSRNHKIGNLSEECAIYIIVEEVYVVIVIIYKIYAYIEAVWHDECENCAISCSSSVALAQPKQTHTHTHYLTYHNQRPFFWLRTRNGWVVLQQKKRYTNPTNVPIKQVVGALQLMDDCCEWRPFCAVSLTVV